MEIYRGIQGDKGHTEGYRGIQWIHRDTGGYEAVLLGYFSDTFKVLLIYF